MHQNGNAAASLAVAEKYVAAFGELAKESNTLMLPSNAGDMSGMVAQAMTIYQKLNPQNKLGRLKVKVKLFSRGIYIHSH